MNAGKPAHEHMLSLNGMYISCLLYTSTVIGLAVVFVLNKIPPIYQKGEQ